MPAVDQPAQAADPVAAELAGRALNRLWWHMVQAWLLGDAGGAAAVRDAFQELVAASRAMGPPRCRASLEALIDARQREWAAAFRSPWYDAERGSLQGQLNERWDVEEDRQALREDLCSTFLSTVEGIKDTLREQLLREASPTAVLAFALGELIDRGVRRENIYRYMSPGAAAEPTAGSDDQLDWGTEEVEEVPVLEVHRLADRRVEPGEVRPDSSWPHKIRRLWSELRMPRDVLPEVSDLGRATSVAEAIKLADQVQRAAEVGLDSLRPLPPGRLHIDEQTQIITLDGKCYPVKHEQAFRWFKLLAEAGGRVVKLKERRAHRITYARPDRLKKILPTELAACVEGEGGKSGGHSLLLPRMPSP